MKDKYKVRVGIKALTSSQKFLSMLGGYEGHLADNECEKSTFGHASLISYYTIR